MPISPNDFTREISPDWLMTIPTSLLASHKTVGSYVRTWLEGKLKDGEPELYAYYLANKDRYQFSLDIMGNQLWANLWWQENESS